LREPTRVWPSFDEAQGGAGVDAGDGGEGDLHFAAIRLQRQRVAFDADDVQVRRSPFFMVTASPNRAVAVSRTVQAGGREAGRRGETETKHRV
jgi:hypothetical protein